MSVMSDTAAAVEGVKERLGTSFEENVRHGRRAVVRAQHAAEDSAAAVVLQVRRHPLSALAVAVAAGALVGGLIGFACARVGCRDSS
jgi:hypothetical protein